MFDIKKNKKQKLSFLRLRGASGAQGISAPASCREAHKRRFLLNPWILRFVCTPLRMTIPTIAFILSLNISESRAAINCVFSNNGKTVTITGKGSDIVPRASCTKSNSSSEEEGWSYNSNWKSTITSANIGTGVNSIGDGAFWGANSLTSITIPDSVTSIGWGAFQGATGLTSITIPDSVTSIEALAFAYTYSLTSITIPEGVTSIGYSAFFNATGLTEIIIPDSLTAEQITKLKNASLKSGLTVYCQGDTKTCKDALDDAGYSYTKVEPADSNRCSGKYIYDTTCRQRNKNECNSVAKYYYNSSANNGAGQCQLLPKTESACTGNGLAWNPTSSKCTNTNYTPSQEANNGNTGGDDTGGTSTGGDISGDFNPADCYNKGQVPYDNQCWNEYPFAKKRWTPAEAAEWLHDGNDNFVVITFKK